MDLLRMKKFIRPWKQKGAEVLKSDKDGLAVEELKNEDSTKAAVAAADPVAEGDDDDDDDFITNEVKRRLKELRKNSFMVLIPEEGYPEEDDGDEKEESSWSDSRKSEGGGGNAFPWCGFDSLYDKYCERMLFFHKMIGQNLKDAGEWSSSKPSPRFAKKKLASSLGCISLKKRDGVQEDSERLQQPQENDPLQNLEIAYVAHLALSWEIIYCQYIQLSQTRQFQSENPASYDHAAQVFQQFQVLLQRFIENEPFEQGSRVEIYARARNSLPKLLQVPTFQGLEEKEYMEDDLHQSFFASDLIKILKESILTFRVFLKMDKKRMNTRSIGYSIAATSLYQVQASLDKKETRVKELCRKKKSWKKKTWPSTMEEVELLFALIDIKVISRVLKMNTLSKEQLLWCEEKMSKLDLSENKLRWDASPILFPC